MALSREAYQELEDIVGKNYISEDPAVLDSYTYSMCSTSLHLGPFWGVFTPRGEAVLLPGSTEEVQAIVRVCNKYKIKFKASSTFWSAMGYPSDENTIQLDMKRMDRILEIDEKNMFAVIEPRVVSAQLQAEVMKVGLNTHIIGAGASCSPLASCTSYLGPGPDTIFLGTGDENMLGLEWVRPDGEILRAGTLGAGLGWFCGEGPGPGIRGIIRGFTGAKGAMGVFTKCAVRLYPWPGPAKLPVVGKAPAYRTPLPDNFRGYTIGFPTWQAYADGLHKIWDSQIGYILHRQYALFGRELKGAVLRVVSDHTKTMDDLEELLKAPEVQEETKKRKIDVEIVLVGMTPRDIEWQESALESILAEIGAWKVEVSTERMQWLLIYLLRLGHKGLNHFTSTSWDSSNGLFGPPEFMVSHIEEMVEYRKMWEKKGVMVDTGGDSAMGPAAGLGGGAMVAADHFCYFDPADKESVDGTCAYYDAEDKYMAEHGLGIELGRMNALCRWSDGKEPPKEVLNNALQAPVFHYQRKIREILNPNDLGDRYYMWADNEAGK